MKNEKLVGSGFGGSFSWGLRCNGTRMTRMQAARMAADFFLVWISWAKRGWGSNG